MSDKLNLGIIGLGLMARYHLSGWQASQRTEVVALSDIDSDVLLEWKEICPTSTLSVEPEDLLSNPDIDVIDICTPNASHAPLAIAALKAGKHVICEKPLAAKPEEIREIIKARDESGKQLMVAHHFRFKGISQAMKKEIDTGTLGEIYHARCWMLRRNALRASPTFIHNELSGGGPCVDIGVHILDLALWMMGSPKPAAVSGVAPTALAHHKGAFSSWDNNKPIPSTFDVEDFAAAFVRFENGSTLNLEVSWLLHHNTPDNDMQLWLYGTEGGCQWPQGEFLHTNYDTQELCNASVPFVEEALEAHALECVEFANAIVEGLPSPVPAEHALTVVEILDGIYKSHSAGKEIQICNEHARVNQ